MNNTDFKIVIGKVTDTVELVTGVKGDKGEPGTPGLRGPVGPAGPAGPKGDRGFTGDTGPVGPRGVQGIQGIQGPIGPKGDNGAVGAKGVKGDIGLTGPKGDIGPIGIQGPKGDKGDDGTITDFGSGYVNYYQVSKSSKVPVYSEPPTVVPVPEAPPVGGVNALSEAIFSTEVVGETGWIILDIVDCDTPDWAITRNGEVIATWDYSHPDVVTKVYHESAVLLNPTEERFLTMEITIYIGETTGLVDYKVISNCKYFAYKHEGAFDPFTRVSFTKFPDVKNFRIKAPKSILTVPATLPITVNSLQKSFEDCDSFNDPNVVGWDVSRISNFSGTFFGCKKFNQPIGVWDMSIARTIDTMFFNAKNFAQPISAWNTRYVTSMVGLFSSHSDINKPPSQDLSMWCVPLLSDYAYTNKATGLGLLEEHTPIWGTCPRGEDLV